MAFEKNTQFANKLLERASKKPMQTSDWFSICKYLHSVLKCAILSLPFVSQTTDVTVSQSDILVV